MPKTIRLNVTHFFIMKILNKREFHSSNILYIEMYKMIKKFNHEINELKSDYLPGQNEEIDNAIEMFR